MPPDDSLTTLDVRRPLIEDDLKNEEDLKNEDDLKNDDDLKNEYCSPKKKKCSKWLRSLGKNTLKKD